MLSAPHDDTAGSVSAERRRFGGLSDSVAASLSHSDGVHEAGRVSVAILSPCTAAGGVSSRRGQQRVRGGRAPSETREWRGARRSTGTARPLTHTRASTGAQAQPPRSAACWGRSSVRRANTHTHRAQAVRGGVRAGVGGADTHQHEPNEILQAVGHVPPVLVRKDEPTAHDFTALRGLWHHTYITR